jgi:lambda repressor-like predicted transcriptional regulator
MHHGAARSVSNNAHMTDQAARNLAELKRIIASVKKHGVSATALARKAGVAQTTINRPLGNKTKHVIKEVTLERLRAAETEIIASGTASPYLQHLTKNAKKRAVIARLLTLTDDQVATIEEFIHGLPKPPAASGEPDDVA